MRVWLPFLCACSTAPAPVAHSETPPPIAAPPAELPAQSVGLSQILITSGGEGTTQRTDAEAEAIARQILKKLADGEDFEALAREYSEAPSAPRGGRLGVFRTGILPADIETALLRTAIGQFTSVQTAEGWQVLRRDPVQEVHLLHILVASHGAAKTQVPRSREQARARAEKALAKLQGGIPFAEVAKEFSDDPSANTGAEFGRLGPGQTDRALEEAAFALKPGEISGIVETPYGFHILLRTDE